MKLVVPQHIVLWNPSYTANNTRLISIIAQCIKIDSVHCRQADRDVDRLIVSTDREVSNPIVVATDTEILVMLVNQACCTHGSVHMVRGLPSCVNVLDTQEKIGALRVVHPCCFWM